MSSVVINNDNNNNNNIIWDETLSYRLQSICAFKMSILLLLLLLWFVFLQERNRSYRLQSLLAGYMRVKLSTYWLQSICALPKATSL